METNVPVVRPAEDAFQIMDTLDDEMIEAELKNRVVDTWSYSFPGSDGKLAEGLSKVGVDEACVEMSKRGYIIREGEIVMRQDPINAQYLLFQVPASLIRITAEGREILMDVVNGSKRQWVKMKKRNGMIVDDPFWYEKGAMKAARNARSRLIPSETKTTILMLARQKGKRKSINPTANAPKSSQKSPEPPQSTNTEKPPDTGEQGKKGWATKKAFIEDLKSYQEKLGEDVYADMLAKHEVNPSELNKLDNIKGPALYDDLAKAYGQLQ